MEILGVVDLPGWLVGIVSFILTVCLYTWYSQNLFNRLGIRTKDTMFFFGDGKEIMKKGFNYIDSDMVEKNGKVFGCFIGNVPSLVISDTDMIKQIMVKEFSKFTDRYMAVSLKDRWYSGVSMARGQHWRFLRSTLSPTFTTSRIKAMSPFIHRCMDTLLRLLDDKINQSPEGFDIVPFLRGYTMDVICSTGFGLEVSAQTDPDNAFIKHMKAFTEFEGMKGKSIIFQFYFPFIRKILPSYFKSDFATSEAFDFFTEATQQAFKERKNEQSAHRDLLQLMINAHKGGDELDADAEEANQLSIEERKQRGLTDEEVLLNSMVFISAGFDTTASVLTWLIVDLAINQDVQEQLVQEIEQEIGQEALTYDNVFKLSYLDMVVNETLRFHPLVPRLNREAKEDVEINGVKIVKGMDCTIAPLALHFMPEYWDEPNKYNPERFAPENKGNINEYAFIPFGQGPRNCIGKRLALLEVKTTLIMLLQRYKFYKTDKLTIPLPLNRMGIAKPDGPVTIKLEKR